MKTKLFMLPFSGGAGHSYSSFLQHAPSWLELVPIDYPGHGKRFAEPLLTDLQQIADDVFRRIRAELASPYAIYGHSFGAALAYPLCQKISAAVCPAPAHLFVSGRRSPTVGKEDMLHRLPAAEFLRGVIAYGGMPEEMLKQPELISLFLPVLRADFTAVETYAHEPAAPPLQVPITALGGSEDRKVPFELILRWQDVTIHPLTARKFAGGHFFPFQHLAEIMQLIADTLQSVQFAVYPQFRPASRHEEEPCPATTPTVPPAQAAGWPF